MTRSWLWRASMSSFHNCLHSWGQPWPSKFTSQRSRLTHSSKNWATTGCYRLLGDKCAPSISRPVRTCLDRVMRCSLTGFCRAVLLPSSTHATRTACSRLSIQSPLWRATCTWWRTSDTSAAWCTSCCSWTSWNPRTSAMFKSKTSPHAKYSTSVYSQS